jgi:hypothetical protein
MFVKSPYKVVTQIVYANYIYDGSSSDRRETLARQCRMTEKP